MRAMKRILILSLILILPLPAPASGVCKAMKWNRASDLSKLTVPYLNSISRSELYANLYYELSSQKSERTPGLGEKLFHYLINTEQNDAKYHLLQALEDTAKLDQPDAQTIPLSGLCSLDKKASAYKGIAEDATANH